MAVSQTDTKLEIIKSKLNKESRCKEQAEPNRENEEESETVLDRIKKKRRDIERFNPATFKRIQENVQPKPRREMGSHSSLENDRTSSMSSVSRDSLYMPPLTSRYIHINLSQQKAKDVTQELESSLNRILKRFDRDEHEEKAAFESTLEAIDTAKKESLSRRRKQFQQNLKAERLK